MISAKTPHVLWSAADGALHDGYDNTNQLWVDQELALGVVFPGMVSDPKQLRLRSSCGMSGSPEILSNLRLYLTGDPAAASPVQNQWPPDGGVEISFDAGVTWIRFTATVGNEADPATWAQVPGEADLVFVCDVLHHVQDRAGWLRKAASEMKPGARFVLVEFKEGKLPEGPPEAVKIPRRQLIELVSQAGLPLESEKADLLPYQVFLVFRKAP